MLNMLWNTVSGENARKKIRLAVLVVHIDESALGLPEEERGQTVEFLRQVKRQYGYVLYSDIFLPGLLLL